MLGSFGNFGNVDVNCINLCSTSLVRCSVAYGVLVTVGNIDNDFRNITDYMSNVVNSVSECLVMPCVIRLIASIKGFLFGFPLDLHCLKLIIHKPVLKYVYPCNTTLPQYLTQ